MDNLTDHFAKEMNLQEIFCKQTLRTQRLLLIEKSQYSLWGGWIYEMDL